VITDREALSRCLIGATSSKLASIMDSIDDLWKVVPGSNIVVYSQFSAFLNLLGSSLGARGIAHRRLHGGLSPAQRHEVLGVFGAPMPRSSRGTSRAVDAPSRGRVLLAPMGGGGVGFHLVSASAVFFAEPWLSRAVEEECVGYVRRLGLNPSGPIRVRKFVVHNSIEEKMIELRVRGEEERDTIGNGGLPEEGMDFFGAIDGRHTNSDLTFKDIRLLFTIT